MVQLLGLVAALFSVMLPLRLPPLPQQQIQNGKVETRRVTAIDREIASLAVSPDPVWVGWRVPMIEGDRGMCGWWSDGSGTVRGMSLDYTATGAAVAGSQRPQIAPPTGPVPLEGGTQLVVLLRLLDGRVERLRTIGDDCPIDAQGRTVYWFDAVTPAESLRYLDTLVKMEGDDRSLPLPRLRDGLASSALGAIAIHRDSGANTILDRIAGGERNASLRQSAMSQLGRLRGAYGFTSLKRMLDAEKAPELRRQLTGALGQAREPGTVEAMRALARDADPKVRAEAVHWFAARGGAPVVGEVVKLIETETDAAVQRRALSGLAAVPDAGGIAPLIQLARTAKDPAVRKEAVRVLSRSADPRATAFMEELIKR